MVLHAPRRSHLKAKRRKTSPHRRRRQRWEGMAPKMAHPRLLDIFLSLQMVSCHIVYIHCSGDLIFWLRDRITKLKAHQIKKNSILAEITKFNAHQFFLPYGMHYTCRYVYCFGCLGNQNFGTWKSACNKSVRPQLHFDCGQGRINPEGEIY